MLTNRTVTAAVLGVAMSCLGAEAHAGHDVEVDIEHLKGYLYRTADGWQLHVRYEVEIEDAYSDDQFDLILYLTEKGRPVHSDQGRLVEYVVPLDNPTEVDDDEVKFERDVTIDLPEKPFINPKRVRLHGMIVYRGDHRPLDHKQDSLKLRPPREFRQQGGELCLRDQRFRFGFWWCD